MRAAHAKTIAVTMPVSVGSHIVAGAGTLRHRKFRPSPAMKPVNSALYTHAATATSSSLTAWNGFTRPRVPVRTCERSLKPRLSRSTVKRQCITVSEYGGTSGSLPRRVRSNCSSAAKANPKPVAPKKAAMPLKFSTGSLFGVPGSSGVGASIPATVSSCRLTRLEGWRLYRALQVRPAVLVRATGKARSLVRGRAGGAP